MKKIICHNCGEAMAAIKDQPYRYKECGLDQVTIIGITIHKCENCGESYVSIPRIKELHTVIGGLICEKKGRLTGEEVRFLRKDMRMKGTEFAMMLSVSAEHISRVENGKKDVSENLGKLLRAMYTIYSKEGQLVDKGTFLGIAQQHEEAGSPLAIELNPVDWLTGNRACACC